MKKLIVALLLAALLVQTVPTTALAATGEIITAAELNRAFRLAGLEVHAGGSVANGADAVSTFLSNADATLESRPNSGYHEGMTPEESWDAQMLLDWISDTMDDRVNAISDVFLRAEALLDRMRAEDPDLYASLTGSGGYGAEYLARCRSVAENAESTRQLLLYYEDRLNAHVTMIDQMSELLETEALGSDLLFDHDRIRLSEKIKAASSGIEEIRKDIVLAAIIDLIYIETWESVIAGTYSGDDAVNRRMHDWLGEIFAWEEGPVEASVPASALQPASTRMSRMAAGARPRAPLANDSDATITVITENDLCFRMIGEGNQPVEGVKVTIRDLANESAQGFSLFSDEEGKVVFNANDFTADNDKVINLSLDVLAEPVGYRDFYAPDLEIKRGAIRREAMVKLT